MNKSNNLTKRRLRGSYLISLLSVTLVLFVLSLFSSLVFYASNISDYLKENIGFEIVVKKGVKESDILDFKKTLDKKPFVKSSEYISKEEATKRLSADLGEDIIDWLGDVENPLLPSIDVRLKADYANNQAFFDGLKAFQQDNLYTQPFFNFNGTNIDTGICDTYFIGATIYPDKFADVDLDAKYSEIYTTLLGVDFYRTMKNAGMGFTTLSFS